MIVYRVVNDSRETYTCESLLVDSLKKADYYAIYGEDDKYYLSVSIPEVLKALQSRKKVVVYSEVFNYSYHVTLYKECNSD